MDKRKLVIPEGLYSFEIIEAMARNSKKGNPMIEVLLKIRHPPETDFIISDYLMLDIRKWKIEHFAESVGLLNYYNAGAMIPEILVGRRGSAMVKTEKQDGWPDQSKVKDYTVASGVQQEPFVSSAPPTYQNIQTFNSEPPVTFYDDDDIPF